MCQSDYRAAGIYQYIDQPSYLQGTLSFLVRDQSCKTAAYHPGVKQFGSTFCHA